MNWTIKQQMLAVAEARVLLKKLSAVVEMENKDLDSQLNDASNTLASLNMTRHDQIGWENLREVLNETIKS